MDIYVVNGLPLHILLVHAVVILVPLSALCVVLAAVWPAVRRRIGVVNALLGLVLIGLIPLTTMAGQWLRDRVHATPLIARHADLGGNLWPWTLSLGILGILTWLWYFLSDRRDRRSGSGRTGRERSGGTARRVVPVVIALAAIGLGGFATWQTVQVGESGSRAIWQNSFSETPVR